MAKNNNLTDFLVNTANAIRSVEGLENTDANKIDPQDFEARIKALKKAPSGNIQLTTNASTDVAAYATATVRSASGISAAEKLAPTKMGFVSVSSTPTQILLEDSYGYEATSNNLHQYTISASTAGWFSSADVGLPNGAYVGYVRQYLATIGTSASGNSLSLTVTPSTANQYVNITAGYRPASYVTVSGDSNLVAGNIKSGVSIFGVSGTYTGLVPTGNIQLTTNASTDVTNYATATVRSASTYTMTGSAVTDNVSIGTLSSGYYPVNAKVKGTVSANTSGWFSSSGAVQASVATQVGKIAAGTITNNTSGGTSSGTVNFGSQIKVGAGYYPSDAYYTAQNPSGNIQLTTSSSTNVKSYATATVRAASGFSISDGGTKYMGAVTVSSTTTNLPDLISGSSWVGYEVTGPSTYVKVSVTTSGWYSGTGDFDGYTGALSAGFIPQYSASTSTSSSGASLSLTVTPGTANKYVNITTGYRPASYLTVSGDANLIAGNIKSGVSIFGVSGTYSGTTPSGNIQLTTNASTNVAAYATATVRSASSYSLAITDKSTTAPTMGSYSSGYYSITTSLTGTLTAGTSGWFSSGSATDSSVIVGRLPRVALTSSTTAPTGTTLVTVTPSTSTKYVYASTGGYFPTPANEAPRIAVSGDSNLTAGNIKQGVSIFGVTGTYQGSGGSSSAIATKLLNSYNRPLLISQTVSLSSSYNYSTYPLHLHIYTENLSTETSGLDVNAIQMSLFNGTDIRTYQMGVQLSDNYDSEITLTNFKYNQQIFIIEISTSNSGGDELEIGYLELGLSRSSNWDATIFQGDSIGTNNHGYFDFTLIGIITGNSITYELYGCY